MTQSCSNPLFQYRDGCTYLATYRHRVRGFSLGAYYEDAPEAARDARGLDAGVIVQNVARNTPAEQSQLQPGDLLLAIDGEVLRNATWLDQALATRQGQDISLTVWPMRDIEQVTISFRLGEST